MFSKRSLLALLPPLLLLLPAFGVNSVAAAVVAGAGAVNAAHDEPPVERPRICIIMFYDDAIAGYARYSHRVNEVYARLHGYAFRHHSEHRLPVEQYDATWEKIGLLRETLAEFEVAVWIDADAVFNRFDVTIESYLAAYHGSDLIVASDYPAAFNGGFMIWRRSDWSEYVLNGVEREREDHCAHWKRTWGHEQSCLLYVLKEFYLNAEAEAAAVAEATGAQQQLRDPLSIIPNGVFNCFEFSPFEGRWADCQPEATFVYHMAGAENDFREQVFHERARDLCESTLAITGNAAAEDDLGDGIRSVGGNWCWRVVGALRVRQEHQFGVQNRERWLSQLLPEGLLHFTATCEAGDRSGLRARVELFCAQHGIVDETVCGDLLEQASAACSNSNDDDDDGGPGASTAWTGLPARVFFPIQLDGIYQMLSWEIASEVEPARLAFDLCRRNALPFAETLVLVRYVALVSDEVLRADDARHSRELGRAMASSATLVTALFDIGSGDLPELSFRPQRSMDSYLDWFQHTLNLRAPMVIFTEPKYEAFVRALRADQMENTHVVVGAIGDTFTHAAHLERVTEIVSDPAYSVRIENNMRIECVMPLYTITQFSKWDWVERALALDPFGSRYYFWLDAGAGRFLQWHRMGAQPFPTPDAIATLEKRGLGDRFLVCQNGKAPIESIGDAATQERHLWGGHNSNVLKGAFLGGTRAAWEGFSIPSMRRTFADMLAAGVVNNDQIALYLLYSAEPGRFFVVPAHPRVPAAGEGTLPLFGMNNDGSGPAAPDGLPFVEINATTPHPLVELEFELGHGFAGMQLIPE